MAKKTIKDEEVKTSSPVDCYYVYNPDNQFVKFYTVEEHGSDAKTKAEAHAEEIGGRVA